MSRSFEHLDAFKRRNIPTPSPCPCCGEKREQGYTDKGTQDSIKWFGLDVGIMACMTYGIKCLTCGLKLEMMIPDRRPRGCGKMTMKQLEVYIMQKVMERWNRRTA